MSETWAQMKRWHKRERRELVEAMEAKRITQTVAAKRLGMSLTYLNNIIHAEGIWWPVKRQGYRQ